MLKICVSVDTKNKIRDFSNYEFLMMNCHASPSNLISNPNIFLSFLVQLRADDHSNKGKVHRLSDIMHVLEHGVFLAARNFG